MAMIYPDKLKPGDTVAIISPATVVKEEYVRGAAEALRKRGFNPLIMPSALGPSHGSFAADRQSRLKDLHDAITNPEVKLIFCARGGYGCVQLLPELPPAMIAANPKWLVGFSDISALHALWHTAGVASLHGPMAKHLTLEPEDDPATAAMFHILCESPEMHYSAPPFPGNRKGSAMGTVRGGNLAVLNGLAATPCDILSVKEGEDVVLFIEDISEAIYAVERMLYRLWLSGSLDRVKGLIVGQFTEYRPDRNFNSVEEMADAFFTRHGITGFPVAFNFPVGHVTHNLPIIEGARVRLEVTGNEVTLNSIPS